MNKNDNKTGVDIELLRKLLQKKYNQEERAQINSWFSDIRYERKLNHIIREHWDELKLKSTDYEFDTNHILDKLHHSINLDSYKESSELPFYRKVYHQLSKIAAVLILPLLAISICYILVNGRPFAKGEKTTYAEIHSPLAARTHFELPDGTTGWLNSGSTLKFPVKFYGTQRKVELSGEGFFDVVKDSKKPFVVNTCDIAVVALGTKFNVLAYPDDETCEITLESGIVVVKKISKSGELVKLTELQPDHQLIISNKTEHIVINEVETEKYTSWKEGKLVLRNDPMIEVVKRISRWYNIEIDLKDKELETYKFRATFEDETFSEVLTLLKISSPIDYVEHKREMLSDGTFSKRRITICLKPGYK